MKEKFTVNVKIRNKSYEIDYVIEHNKENILGHVYHDGNNEVEIRLTKSAISKIKEQAKLRLFREEKHYRDSGKTKYYRLYQKS